MLTWLASAKLGDFKNQKTSKLEKFNVKPVLNTCCDIALEGLKCWKKLRKFLLFCFPANHQQKKPKNPTEVVFKLFFTFKLLLFASRLHHITSHYLFIHQHHPTLVLSVWVKRCALDVPLFLFNKCWHQLLPRLTWPYKVACLLFHFEGVAFFPRIR